MHQSLNLWSFHTCYHQTTHLQSWLFATLISVNCMLVWIQLWLPCACGTRFLPDVGMSRKRLATVSPVRRFQDYYMTSQIHPHFQNQEYNKQSDLQSQESTSQEHYTFVKLEFNGRFTFVSSHMPQHEQSILKCSQIYQCRPSSLHIAHLQLGNLLLSKWFLIMPPHTWLQLKS